MASEESFYTMWSKALKWLELPITIGQLRSSFSDLNPLSHSASNSTRGHATFYNREVKSVEYAHLVLELDKLAAPQNRMFKSFADLSRDVGCWDWSVDDRGPKCKWSLQNE